MMMLLSKKGRAHTIYAVYPIFFTVHGVYAVRPESPDP
jgi:hypothetical protein